MKPKKPATAKVHELRDKLQALAERGIDGERTNAKAKLATLEARFDFKAPVMKTRDLFKGTFTRAEIASPIRSYDPEAWDVANAVKWAIEKAANIPCLFRDGALCAQAAPATARRLQGIAETVTGSYQALWAQMRAAGVNPLDRETFMLGLYDGMMNEARPPGQPLPSRRESPRKLKGKRGSITHAPGLNLHPYSVAVELGRQIRFEVPLATIAAELDQTIKGALPAKAQP